MRTLILPLASATSSIDVGVDHELAEPPTTSPSAAASGVQVTVPLEVVEKLGFGLGGAWFK